MENITFRKRAKKSDAKRVAEIMKSSGFFEEAPDEIDSAINDLNDSISLPEESEDCRFIFAEQNGKVVGFLCYGRESCTVNTFYFYWVAVDNNLRGGGVGKKLFDEGAKDIKALGGRKIFLQTAGRDQYIPTQKFYEKNGFILEAVLKDYYVVGDSCYIYSKVI